MLVASLQTVCVRDLITALAEHVEQRVSLLQLLTTLTGSFQAISKVWPVTTSM
jgi:hypothetical protein